MKPVINSSILICESLGFRGGMASASCVMRQVYLVTYDQGRMIHKKRHQAQRT